MKRLLLFSSWVFVSCATKPHLPKLQQISNPDCREYFLKSHQEKTQDQLNRVSELFSRMCYHETVALGKWLRERHRDKFYSVTGELAEFVVPEGTVTDYVLQSHERTYLSLLISLSYLKMEKIPEGQVELKRAYEEHRAQVYHSDNDLIFSTLLASLWDPFDVSLSRPLWKNVAQAADPQSPLQTFSQMRIQEIDAHPDQTVNWNIEGFSYLPPLDWSFQLTQIDSQPFLIQPQEAFPLNCQSSQDLVVSTEPWSKQVQYRQKKESYPLAYSKALTRIPVGLALGAVGTAGGAVIGLGGCGLAAQADGGAHELCEASIRLGFHLANESFQIATTAMKPDLRFWSKMPRALRVSRPHSPPTPCSRQVETTLIKTVQLSPKIE